MKNGWRSSPELAFQDLWGKLRQVQSFQANRFSRYLIAALGGLLWTGAFPDIGVAGLAWIAPGVLAVAALGRRGGESFRIGYIGGLAHYLSMLYWLLLIPFRWHGIPVAPAVGWAALSAFLSLFPATWVWLLCAVTSPKSKVLDSQALNPEPVSLEDARYEARNDGAGILSSNWFRRALWAVIGGVIWVALEMLLARIFGGFPWDLLGVSQYQLVPLIQVARVTGVYGVSFLAVWVSLSMLSACLTIIRRPGRSSAWVGEVFIPVLIVAVVFNLGLRQTRREPPPARTLKVTLVQPSIPQSVIWDGSADLLRFEQLVRWSDQILTTNQTDLLIWPESAIPRMLRYDTNTFLAITNLTQRHHVWMIVGSDDAEPRGAGTNPEEVDYFNSSFLISPKGELRQRYIKRDLVIFGEYLPLQHWLPFLKLFTPITGSFTPGTHPVQFDLDDLGVKTSVLICFEDVFPHVGRTDVQADTDFLVNITNDGWFDEGAAQWQQAVSALFRTVENAVPLVRCTNNGLTCWMDAQGRIREVLRDPRGTIYGPGFLTVEIPILRRGEKHLLTFYTRHGDWFGWSCVVIAGLVALENVKRNSKPQRRNSKAEA